MRVTDKSIDFRYGSGHAFRVLLGQTACDNEVLKITLSLKLTKLEDRIYGFTFGIVDEGAPEEYGDPGTGRKVDDLETLVLKPPARLLKIDVGLGTSDGMEVDSDLLHDELNLARQILKIRLIDQNLSGFAALERPDYAGLFKEVNQPGCTRVSHLESSLEQ